MEATAQRVSAVSETEKEPEPKTEAQVRRVSSKTQAEPKATPASAKGRRGGVRVLPISPAFLVEQEAEMAKYLRFSNAKGIERTR